MRSRCSSRIRRALTTTQDSHRTTVAAILYPVRAGRGYLVRAPIGGADQAHNWEYARWPEDVDLRHWFPFGTRFFRLDMLPGTTFSLNNHYTVVTTADPHRCPDNHALHSVGAVDVQGNVVVLRHAVGGRERVTNVYSAERRFVDLLVIRRVFVRPPSIVHHS